jgi:RND family efflux transporter MFP subunit
MNRLLKVLVPILIVGAAMGVFSVMVQFKKPAEQIEAPRTLLSVQTLTAKPQNITLTLPSQGIIDAQRVTTIASEAAGRVTAVSPKWNIGEQFDENEILVEIDPSDYATAVTQAEAALADARSSLASEKARTEQALREWEKVSQGVKPTDLALRKPQIESATSRLKAAEASLLKAQHDLERTKIRAPFSGRIRTLRIDLGSYLTPGAPIAEFFSLGTFEVRLPLSLDDYAFVKHSQTDPAIPVQLKTSFGGSPVSWTGKIIRTEGEIDRASRSVYLIASVEASQPANSDILKPGLFVHAEIEGQTLDNVFPVPRSSFLDEKHLLVVDSQNRIRRRAVTVVRQTGSHWLVSEGLKAGELVCITTIAAPVDGMEVSINSQSPDAFGGSQQP